MAGVEAPIAGSRTSGLPPTRNSGGGIAFWWVVGSFVAMAVSAFAAFVLILGSLLFTGYDEYSQNDGAAIAGLGLIAVVFVGLLISGARRQRTTGRPIVLSVLTGAVLLPALIIGAFMIPWPPDRVSRERAKQETMAILEDSLPDIVASKRHPSVIQSDHVWVCPGHEAIGRSFSYDLDEDLAATPPLTRLHDYFVDEDWRVELVDRTGTLTYTSLAAVKDDVFIDAQQYADLNPRLELHTFVGPCVEEREQGYFDEAAGRD